MKLKRVCLDPDVPQVWILSVIRPMITQIRPSNRLCFGTRAQQTTFLLCQLASREVQMVGGARQRLKGWGREREHLSPCCYCATAINLYPSSAVGSSFQLFSSIPKPALSYYLRGSRSSQIGHLIGGLSPRSTEPLFQASFFKQIYWDITHIPLHSPI